MIQFVAFVTVSLVVALLTLDRLKIAVTVAIALFVFVPVVASSAVLGHLGNDFHPGAVFVLVLFFVQLLTRVRLYGADFRAQPLLNVILATFVLAALVTTQLGSASIGQLIPLNQIVAPVALFWLIRRALADDDRAAALLVRVVVIFAVIQALVALAVLWGFLQQPWRPQLSSYSFYTDGFSRTFGTTDHPLVLAGFLVFGLCLVPNLRSGLLQAACVVVLTAGLISTESRTGLVLGLAVVILAILRGGLPARARFALAAALAAGAVVFFVSPLSSELLSKFSDDGGSAGARSDALPVLLGALPSHLFVGGGAGSNGVVALIAHLPTSLENALFMYTLDFGAAFTALYFGAMVAIVAARKPRVFHGGRLAGLAAILTVLSFSSVAVNSGIGAHLWIALALAAAPLSARAGSPDPVVSPARELTQDPAHPVTELDERRGAVALASGVTA